MTRGRNTSISSFLTHDYCARLADRLFTAAHSGGALIMMVFVFFSGCATVAARDGTVLQNYRPSGTEAVREMIGALAEINRTSPASYAADFYVEGASAKSRFKSAGTARFDRDRGLLQITFVDYIFRSPIALFFLDGKSISVFYPIEKKLILDDVKNFNTANYTGIGIDFDILLALAEGKIPVLTDYKVRESLTARKGAGSMLIIENNESIETISFDKTSPDKLLFINKNTRNKTEIYLKKFIQEGDSRFFNVLKLYDGKSGLELDITFNKVQLNAPVKVKTIKDVKIPSDVQIIRMIN
jgi:hypothetical protein